jgi:hypothetical protein
MGKSGYTCIASERPSQIFVKNSIFANKLSSLQSITNSEAPSAVAAKL